MKPLAAAALREHTVALAGKTFPYIEPLMYQLPMGDLDRQPTREEIERRLEMWSRPLNPRPKAHRGDYDFTRCAATLASGLRDPDGKLCIAQIGQYNWIAGAKWAAQLPLNLDPEIPGGAGELDLTQLRKEWTDPHWGDGRYLDSFSAHTNRADYSVEHMTTADFPPTWTVDAAAPAGWRPCMPLAVSAFEYANALRKMHDETGRLILVNQYGHSDPCPFHIFDCLGKEHWVPGAGQLLQRYRVVSYQKVVSDLPSPEPLTPAELREFLLTGVFPGGYGDPGWGQNEMRATYRKIIPLLRLQHQLGWAPVPWARSEQRGVLIERFGGMDKPLALAVLNRLEPRIVEFDIDTARVGGAQDAWLREMLDDSPLDWSWDAGRLRVRVGMASGETKLLIVGNAAVHAQVAKTLLADRLRDARRCAAEYGLREKKEHPLLAELATLPSSDITPDSLVALAARVAGQSVLDRRIAELLREAAPWAQTPTPRQLQPVAAPAINQVAEGLPWSEDFSAGLDAERWTLPRKNPHGRLEVKDGRLEVELSPQETSLSLHTQRTFDFGTRPLEFTWMFQFNHGGHPFYLMQGVKLAPAAGGGDDFLHVRVNPGIQVRLENGDTPASNYQYSLTPYVKLPTNAPHRVRLLLDATRYRLELDDKLLGEGAHDLGFTRAAIHLSVSTGHRGHGDVVWWDDFAVRPAEGWPSAK